MSSPILTQIRLPSQAAHALETWLLILRKHQIFSDSHVTKWYKPICEIEVIYSINFMLCVGLFLNPFRLGA